MIAEKNCNIWVLAAIVGLAFPGSAADNMEAPMIEEDISIDIYDVGPSVISKGVFTLTQGSPEAPA